MFITNSKFHRTTETVTFGHSAVCHTPSKQRLHLQEAENESKTRNLWAEHRQLAIMNEQPAKTLRPSQNIVQDHPAQLLELEEFKVKGDVLCF